MLKIKRNKNNEYRYNKLGDLVITGREERKVICMSRLRNLTEWMV